MTALDVKEGDIVYTCGYRCKASNITHTIGHDNLPVARYTLNSAPNETHTAKLPRGYEGMRSGGNKLAFVAIER